MSYQITDLNTEAVYAQEKRIGAAQAALMRELARGKEAVIRMCLENGHTLILQKLSKIGGQQ